MRVSLLTVALIMLMTPAAMASEGNYNKKSDNSPKTVFVPALGDVPLMQGLAIIPEDDVLFVTGSGRIVQTIAAGGVDIDDVYEFYQNSLPQLGWKAADARTFERNNERLRIDASAVNPEAKTVVHFSVEPIAVRPD